MQCKHKQSPILEEGDVIFTVDKKLQRLMQLLWDHGILTFNSCQLNVRNSVWIQFELGSWIELVRQAYAWSSDLEQFIDEECELNLLSCDDGYPDENGEYWIQGDQLIWSASVRFDRKQLKCFQRIVQDVLTQPISHKKKRLK